MTAWSKYCKGGAVSLQHEQIANSNWQLAQLKQGGKSIPQIGTQGQLFKLCYLPIAICFFTQAAKSTVLHLSQESTGAV